MTRIVYLPAGEWGMRWARPPIAHDMPVDELYVHHTAGGYIADPAEAFRHLNEMAIREGMSAGDYTLLVHRNRDSGVVTVGELRGPWMPAATYRSNRVSKAVCAMGYFHPGHRLSRRPHPDELDGIAWGLGHCIRVGWAKPTSVIRGHRENPYSVGDHATACPGDYLFAHMSTIRILTTPPEVHLMDSSGGYLVAKTPNGAYWIGTPVWHRWCETATMAQRYIDALPCRDLATGAVITYRGNITEVSEAEIGQYMGRRVA